MSTDIDECSEGTDSCDDALSVCFNYDGGYNCTCNTGYHDDDQDLVCTGKSAYIHVYTQSWNFQFCPELQNCPSVLESRVES